MKFSKQKIKRVRPILGTFVEIRLEAEAPIELLHTWITAGFDQIEKIDRLMSFHRSESDLSRLNRSEPGHWVEVHPHTRHVLRASNQLFQASGGIFDIRCIGT